jgi:alkylhydroperoxidase family enzyme
MEDALLNDRTDDVFKGKELALLGYARNLTLDPASLTAASIDALREAGASDGEILEVNQVAGYFAYANRVVLGLGVTLDGEVRAEQTEILF